jgi:hypothetical protein
MYFHSLSKGASSVWICMWKNILFSLILRYFPWSIVATKTPEAKVVWRINLSINFMIYHRKILIVHFLHWLPTDMKLILQSWKSTKIASRLSVCFVWLVIWRWSCGVPGMYNRSSVWYGWWFFVLRVHVRFGKPMRTLLMLRIVMHLEFITFRLELRYCSRIS